jgi:hypothetical protein
MYFSNLDCDIGYSDLFFCVDPLTLENKGAALLENTGKQCPCDAMLYP